MSPAPKQFPHPAALNFSFCIYDYLYFRHCRLLSVVTVYALRNRPGKSTSSVLQVHALSAGFTCPWPVYVRKAITTSHELVAEFAKLHSAAFTGLYVAMQYLPNNHERVQIAIGSRTRTQRHAGLAYVASCLEKEYESLDGNGIQAV